MDNVIALIVIVVAILSAISKAKKKQKTQQTVRKPSAPGELAAKLKDFFAEVQEKFNARTRQGGSGPSSWGPLLQTEKVDESPDHYDMSMEDLVLEEEAAPPKPDKKPAVRAPIIQVKPAEPKATPETPQPLAEKPILPNVSPDLAMLRRAVVWSEILGPPVALRDDPRDW